VGLSVQDKAMMEFSLESLRLANERLRKLNLEDAVRDASGFPIFACKKEHDTLMFDAVAEESIVEYHSGRFSQVYGINGVVLSEERGMGCRSRIYNETPVILSDPLDGSKNLSSLVRRHIGLGWLEKLGELFDFYRDEAGEKVRVTAPVSALSLIRDGELKYSLVLNLFTGEVYASYEGGVFAGDINLAADVGSISRRVEWRDDAKPLLLCNRAGADRCKNYTASHLEEFFGHDLSATYFVGPSRFTYLLKENQGHFPQIGVIAHNREGIQEIISNLGMAVYSGGALRAYKLFCPEYELPFFKGEIAGKGLDTRVLDELMYPGDYRDTTVIVPSANEGGVRKMEGAVEKGYGMRLA
jgi:hypothetical protein